MNTLGRIGHNTDPVKRIEFFVIKDRINKE
jgi:hypothetical protein